MIFGHFDLAADGTVVAKVQLDIESLAKAQISKRSIFGLKLDTLVDLIRIDNQDSEAYSVVDGHPSGLLYGISKSSEHRKR